MTIELSEIHFSHASSMGSPVLAIEHWSVSEKERVFLHGPSGSGKSTLLNIVSGMLECRSGSVRVLGEPLGKMSRRQRDRFRADHIGYVFQRFNLVPFLNALENVALAQTFSSRGSRRYSSHAASQLLESLNVTSSDWKKPVNQLSSGQQQRVAIARALVNRPGLIIADEPTSSLDHDNRDAFLTLLLSLVEEQDATLLFVSHDMTLARHFNRVQALSDINSVN